MNMPQPIRVGPYTIKFEMIDPDEEKDEETVDAWGFFDMRGQRICLDPELEQHPTLYAEVIMHEVQHAINEVYGVPEDGHKEEKMVTQGARGWTQVLMDNPQLLDFVKMKLH